MPKSWCAVLAVGLLYAAPAMATPSPNPEPDPLLARLIQEAQTRNPELARSQALAEAEQERIPQAKALPDPTLSLGLQNDGFQSLQVGRMETSYYQIMLTQPLPWPGKRSLRGEIARLGADASRTGTERTRLSLVADVKRAYYGLLLVRGERELLQQQQALWDQAAEIAKVRYEVGQGSQADLLRSQLERNRLRQAALGLRSEEGVRLAQLNRLRGIPPGEPLPTQTRLIDLKPDLATEPDWAAKAESESPEILGARLGTRQAERSLDLARRNRYPDFAVSAGYMPRGSLDPMWQVGVSISLPLWSRQKQQRAMAEQEIRRRAQGSEAESIRNLLLQRIQERKAQLEAARETLRIFQDGLLIQGEASFQANLAQYQTGRAPFLSVLEALNGWVADRGAYLQVMAQVLALQIAQEEFNLTGTPAISAPALSGGSMGMGGSPSVAASRPTVAPGGDSAPAMATM